MAMVPQSPKFIAPYALAINEPTIPMEAAATEAPLMVPQSPKSIAPYALAINEPTIPVKTGATKAADPRAGHVDPWSA
jgi:hypothetical protein